MTILGLQHRREFEKYYLEHELSRMADEFLFSYLYGLIGL